MGSPTERNIPPGTPHRGDIFGGPRRSPETTSHLINRLVQLAARDALFRLPKDASTEAQVRVANAIKNRFLPHVEESEIIAEQLTSPEYRQFVQEQKEFLGVRLGVVVCPDGRIAASAIVDPRVGHVHRRLQGMLETKGSSKHPGKFVVDDPLIDSAVAEAIVQRPDNPYFVELMGPHIDSIHPEHGCGAAKGKISKAKKGVPTAVAMKNGAIPEYFDELGEKFSAFTNTITDASGKATTFDMTHDSYSQGLIFGLKDTYHLFDPSKSLRENLVTLHAEGKILMTEFLDDKVRTALSETDLAGSLKETLDDPNHFAQNFMLIGRIAKELTLHHEQNGFSEIGLPKHFTEGHSEATIRALAYHAIRNSVYRVLGGIEPGNHKLLHHPEKIIRIGPIGAAFNRESISFIQVTPPGDLRPEDISGAEALYGLFEGIAPTVGIDLENEARIIMVTGEYHPTGDPDQTRLQEVQRQVNKNAAKLREVFAEGIRTGSTVVIGAIFESGTRKMTHIVS